tara:strand:+ start:190 stop:612 length:423 start_codon:yes stop_codon:yes gene_type:complete
LKKRISDKDQKDWDSFINNKDKLENKDFLSQEVENKKEITKKIDLHGLSLEEANKFVEKFILDSFNKNVNKIIVITGKGLRSKNLENPYVSEDLSILKNSVPEFVRSRSNLMKIIKHIKDASVEDGGEGAFYIYLKKFKE